MPRETLSDQDLKQLKDTAELLGLVSKSPGDSVLPNNWIERLQKNTPSSSADWQLIDTAYDLLTDPQIGYFIGKGREKVQRLASVPAEDSADGGVRLFLDELESSAPLGAIKQDADLILQSLEQITTANKKYLQPVLGYLSLAVRTSDPLSDLPESTRKLCIIGKQVKKLVPLIGKLICATADVSNDAQKYAQCADAVVACMRVAHHSLSDEDLVASKAEYAAINEPGSAKTLINDTKSALAMDRDNVDAGKDDRGRDGLAQLFITSEGKVTDLRGNSLRRMPREQVAAQRGLAGRGAQYLGTIAGAVGAFWSTEMIAKILEGIKYLFMQIRGARQTLDTQREIVMMARAVRPLREGEEPSFTQWFYYGYSRVESCYGILPCTVTHYEGYFPQFYDRVFVNAASFGFQTIGALLSRYWHLILLGLVAYIAYDQYERQRFRRMTDPSIQLPVEEVVRSTRRTPPRRRR